MVFAHPSTPEKHFNSNAAAPAAAAASSARPSIKGCDDWVRSRVSDLQWARHDDHQQQRVLHPNRQADGVQDGFGRLAGARTRSRLHCGTNSRPRHDHFLGPRSAFTVTSSGAQTTAVTTTTTTASNTKPGAGPYPVLLGADAPPLALFGDFSRSFRMPKLYAAFSCRLASPQITPTH